MKRTLDLMDHTSLDERLKSLWDYELEDFIFNLFVVPSLFPCNRAKKRQTQISQFHTRLILYMVGELRQNVLLQHQT